MFQTKKKERLKPSFSDESLESKPEPVAPIKPQQQQVLKGAKRFVCCSRVTRDVTSVFHANRSIACRRKSPPMANKRKFRAVASSVSATDSAEELADGRPRSNSLVSVSRF